MVCYIASIGNAKGIWDALATLYQGYSEQRNIYLEKKLRFAQMQKEEYIDPFITKLQETQVLASYTNRCHFS